jgi:hypothetical protein
MRIPGVTAATKIGPDAPTLVSVTDIGTNREFNNGAVDVAFTAATTTPSNPAVSYKVEVSNGITVTGASSPIRVQNLANTTLTFKVRGINVLGIEGPTSAISSPTAITTVPNKPEIGIAGSGNASAVVPFSLSNTGGRDIVEYIIAGSPSGSATGSSSPITVSSLANGTDYTFTVVARNANGNSIPSNSSNVVRPAAPVSSGGGGGGGGIVTTTYYCYTSTCLSTIGGSQYSVSPTLSSITTTPNNSTNTVVAPSYISSETTVVYCNTNQTTAANGAKQTDCEGAVIPDGGTAAVACDPADDVLIFGDCPAADSFLWVTVTTFDECNGTFFTEIAQQAAWTTFTIYDCNGVATDSGAGPYCSQNKVLSSTQINGVCGYVKPASTGATTGDRPYTGGATTDSGATASGGNNVPASTSTVVTTTDTDLMFAILDAFPEAELGYVGATDTWVITIPDATPASSSPSGGGGCFAFGTKITMADGSLKNMEDLVLGDIVRTFDIPGAPDTDEYKYWLSPDAWTTDSTEGFEITTTKVTHIHKGPFKTHFVINGSTKVTHEHLIFVKRNGTYSFTPASKIRVGDKLLTESLEEIDITDIQLKLEPIFTVEIDVEDKDFYFANGILAHNLRAPIDYKY